MYLIDGLAVGSHNYFTVSNNCSVITLINVYIINDGDMKS